MNKTVNINLANVLFHIDEEAYNKMRRYLESIKRSFANTAGSDEILADIEARIAELFHEKLENERQVITEKEVDEVIAIMGQPEDYMVDEDIFEDEPKTSNTNTNGKRTKKFYRDTEHKYVAGVSSGLAHYFNIDPLWIRLLWIILTIGSTGGFILIYGLLWILIPEASTTSQKLDMRGEAINISNIERKVKEGFDDVAAKVKNADYSKVKNSGKTFFDTVGDIIMFLFKIFGKFIGIILIVIGASAIIGMFIGMLTVGTLDWIHLPGLENILDNITGTSVWVWSLLIFFAVGIPFFFLLYLGLKILVNNLKSIGSIAKFSLLGLWLISIICLIVMGIKEAAAHAYSGGITTEKELYLENSTDTLNIELVRTDLWDNGSNVRMDDMVMTYDDDGQPILLSDDVRFRIKKSNDTIIRIEVKREANGPSVVEARSVAEEINYSYNVIGNTLILNDFLTTNSESKFKDQEVRVNLYLPVGTTIKYNSESDRNWVMNAETDRSSDDLEDFYWKMGSDNELKCQDCPEEKEDDEDDKNRIRINENGVDININEDGESFKMKVNEDGVNIKAKDNSDNVDININSEGVKINTDDN
ncbi:PspC domain-containing protein [Aurantibacter crassamenti]|uniref:PspC domain-containing protein n=1 Tax=Aurantibacter crassamenti TaxID=1837375 RepID=UPI001939D70D|nr:PspC domain-containing protein [Aurantibacter crassamenti]MBM1107685.1 PspC domain-containing protein [Aurantibacter crassamenti]